MSVFDDMIKHWTECLDDVCMISGLCRDIGNARMKILNGERL